MVTSGNEPVDDLLILVGEGNLGYFFVLDFRAIEPKVWHLGYSLLKLKL